MAAPVGSLVVRIGSDIRGLTTGLGKGAGLVSDFGAAASRAAKRIALIGTAAAAAGVAIAVKLTRDGLKSVDAMVKLGRSIGATQAEMVALNAAADLVGISQEKMQKNVQAFTKRLGEALEGTGEAVGALDKLGLSARKLSEMPLPEALALVAQRVQTLGSAAERAAVESDLFSRAGIGMLTTTDDLAGAIRLATKDTKDFGVAVSQVDAAKIEAANDAMARIGLVIQGVSNQLAVRLAPFLEDIADRIRTAAQESSGFGDSIETGLEAGIELSVLFGRSMRIAAITVLSAAVAAEKLRGQTQEGNQTLTRFFARMLLVGDAAATLELDKEFRKADEAAAEAGVKVSGLEKALLQVVESGGSLDAVADALERIRNAPTAPEDVPFVGPTLPPDLTEGGIEDGKLEENIQNRLARIQDGFLSQEIAQDEFQARLEESSRGHVERMLAIEEDRGRRAKAIQAEEMRNRIAVVAGGLAQLTSAFAGLAGDQFELQKGLSIASATLSGLESIVHSYNFGTSLGGPALGATLAGIAAATTAAQIAQISAQEFKKGGGGAPAVAAGPTGGAPAPGPGGGAGGGVGPSRTVNISLVGQTHGTQQVRELIEQINEALDDGARLRVV